MPLPLEDLSGDAWKKRYSQNDTESFILVTSLLLVRGDSELARAGIETKLGLEH